MSRTFLTVSALLLAGVSDGAAADLAIRREADRLVVTEAGGDPVASFVFAASGVGRPAIRDLAGPGGTIVTRPCPPRPGIDADDHATMHPGVWLGFSDLSGADPWRHKTAVRFAGFDGEPGVIDGVATFSGRIDYLDKPADGPDALVACRERSITGRQPSLEPACCDESPARGRQKSRRGRRYAPMLRERSPTPEPHRDQVCPVSCT